LGEIQHPHNLPAQITPLLGREVELRQLVVHFKSF
jgi:hypothetical protein